MDCALVMCRVAAVLLAVSRCAWGRPHPQLPAPTGPAGIGLSLLHVAAATAPDQPHPAPDPPVPVPSPFVAPAKTATIVQQHFEQAPDGQYRWNYATSDGAAQEAVGVLTNAPNPSIAVEGSYSYQSPEGEGRYQVHYIADEFGFQPTGTHIHPAILEAVRRQVEFARSEPVDFYNEAGFPANQQVGAEVAPSGPHPALL